MEKKVYFNLRTSSRERMWDTAKEASRVCIPILPDIVQQTSIARSAKAGMVNRRVSFSAIIKRFILRNLPILNYQSIDQGIKSDLLYMWGAFPRIFSKKPYVIELDNPFVLSYYNTKVFYKRLRTIRKKLKQAHKVTFLSEAARHHTIQLVGNDLSDTFEVLHPFMERNYLKNHRPNDGVVRFLFVGLGFRRKGGPELVKAFSRLPQSNIKLTVISNVDDETKEKYKHDGRIEFLPPQPREVLFNDFYPTRDVFVFPSLHESLGVVVLEALSFGMGIIVTDLYATPELVNNHKNGVLLPHPFLTHTIFDGVPIIDCVTPARLDFADKYLNENTFYDELEENIFISLQEAMGNVKSWQKHSEELFDEKFSPAAWTQQLKKIIAD